LVYTYYVEARNAYGYSVFSNTVAVLAAQVPDQPAAPVTTWNPDDVIISWITPDNAGSAVTGFTLTIGTSDLTYLTETTHCDMTSSTATQCTVPVTVLRAEPFSLPWGSNVYAKVIATNVYGDSAVSPAGTGAVITTTPDAPVNLAENELLRTKS